jgi:hypothetical protein
MTDTTTETDTVDTHRLAARILGANLDDPGLGIFENALREARLSSGDPEQIAAEAERAELAALASRLLRGY